MEIVAINEDDRADGNGKAGLTWISKTVLNTAHRWNPGYVANQDGTGSLGGWENCELRAYLRGTIKPLIPETIRNGIVQVNKISSGFNSTTENAENKTTIEDVWIPSSHELIDGSSDKEKTGATYPYCYNSRIKKRWSSETTLATTGYFTRSAYNNLGAVTVTIKGAISYADVTNPNSRIALGFCTN